MQRFVVALLAVVVCSGCLRATTTITVKQDGSGTLDQEVGASAQALAMLRNFGSAGGAAKPGAEVQMFGPEQAQAMAASMGVRFVSGEPVKTAALEGYRAHFAFDDVTKVRLNLAQGAGGPTAAATDKPAEPPFSFGFVRKEGTSVLTIKTADQMPGAGGALPQLPGGGSQQENAQMMAMVMPMLRGLFVDVTLAVDGPVVKSSVPAAESRLTLLQFDFDKVAATEGALQKLQQITDPKMLKDIPGVRMVTEPLITIEFGR